MSDGAALFRGPGALEQWVASRHRKALRRLPSGVLTPGYDDGEVQRFIRAFNSESGAEDYAARHATVQLRGKLSALLRSAAVTPVTGATVLDLGTGSGSTIAPIFEVLAHSRIVATDLSPFLLEILLQRNAGERLCAVQESAEELDFLPESFDCVVGNAVLHHLFRPDRALQRVADVLKPGGAALFFEPCENGKVLAKLAVDSLMGDARFATLDPGLQHWMRRFTANMSQRWKHRASERPEIYQNKDDKWIFTRSYFLQEAVSRHFSRIHVEATEKSRRAISNNIKSKFRQQRITPPEWVIQALDAFEDQFSPEFLLDNPQALSIALVK